MTGQEVIGRIRWDATHESHFAVFPNKTAFEKWRRDMRKVAPGLKTEWEYLTDQPSLTYYVHAHSERGGA